MLLDIGGLDHAMQQIGIGIASQDSTSGGFAYRQSDTTIDLASTSDTNPFLTGVVFNDTAGNGEYQPGEGLSGVTIAVSGGDRRRPWMQAVTASSSRRAPTRSPPAGLPAPIARTVIIGNDNVRLNFDEDPNGATLAASSSGAVIGQLGTFTAIASGDTPSSYSARIDWGDGNDSFATLTANPDGTFSVQGSNTYASPGVYAVRVLITHLSDGQTIALNATADVGGSGGSGGSGPASPSPTPPASGGTTSGGSGQGSSNPGTPGSPGPTSPGTGTTTGTSQGSHHKKKHHKPAPIPGPRSISGATPAIRPGRSGANGSPVPGNPDASHRAVDSSSFPRFSLPDAQASRLASPSRARGTGRSRPGDRDDIREGRRSRGRAKARMEHEGSEDRAGYRTGDGHGRHGGGPGARRSDEGGSRRGPPPLRSGPIRPGDPLFRSGARAAPPRYRGPAQARRLLCRDQPARQGPGRLRRRQSLRRVVREVFNGGFNTNTAGLSLPSTDPFYPNSFGNRGIALLMLGRNQEALDSFQQAVNLWNRPWNYRGDMPPEPCRRLRGTGAGLSPAGPGRGSARGVQPGDRDRPVRPERLHGSRRRPDRPEPVRRGDRRL